MGTGHELGDGGVYVAQEPNLMFLKDTDGDGKADLRKLVLHDTRVSSDSLQYIAKWKNLRQLDLTNTQVNGSDFTIQWSADGIFYLDDA